MPCRSWAIRPDANVRFLPCADVPPARFWTRSSQSWGPWVSNRHSTLTVHLLPIPSFRGWDRRSRGQNPEPMRLETGLGRAGKPPAGLLSSGFRYAAPE